VSEATSLFSLLFGVPALMFAIVFAAIALKAPRGGAVLCAMLLASVLPVVFWARSAGYLEGAGALLLGSLVISALGLLVALFKLLFGPKASTTPRGQQ
jgi:hypothetical protein